MSKVFANIKEIVMRRKQHDGIMLASGELLKAMVASEKEYLAFGGDLQSLHEKAKEISRTSSSLIGLTTGERLKGFRSGLEEAFEKMNDIGAESKRGTEALESILEKAVTIEANLHTFQNVVRTLQVLCNFIRIESVRTGSDSTAFDALAVDVSKLAKTINEKSSAIVDQISSLTLLVRDNLAKILGFEQAQQHKGKFIAESIQKDLHALNERHHASLIKLKKLEAASQEITENIGEIVSSLQFHDITRQRIKHVTSALEKPSAIHPGAVEGTASGFSVEGFIARRMRGIHPVSGNGIEEAYKTCRLQRAQLVHTRQELASATGKIMRNLQSVAGRIKEISQEAEGVTKDARGAGTSFFSEMKEAIAGLAGALSEHEEISLEIGSAVEGFNTAVSSLEGFLQDIVRIGIEMKMVALNAAIHAAHVGDAGLALGVLAGHIHGLSQETSSRIQSIGEDLHFIFDHALSLKEFAASASGDKVRERMRMIENVQQMVPSFGKLNEESILLLDRMEQIGNGLWAGIQQSGGRVHFHEGILQGIDALIAEIDRECTRIEKDLGQGRLQTGDGAAGLEELAQSYTMQRERDVHHSTLISSKSAFFEAQELDQAAGGERNNGEELGENVELF